MMTKTEDDLRKDENTAEETAEEKKPEETDGGSGSAESEKSEDVKEDSGPDKEDENEAKQQEEDPDTRYVRLMADFQNYKKRVEKEKKDLYSYANEKLLSEMLAVVDNFERALEQEDGGEGFKEGMEMIFKQLDDVLKKSGLSEIPAIGEDFDPNFHNAVMTEETEEYESGKVSGVMQKGYTLNGKVIRPSMVKVAQ